MRSPRRGGSLLYRASSLRWLLVPLDLFLLAPIVRTFVRRNRRTDAARPVPETPLPAVAIEKAMVMVRQMALMAVWFFVPSMRQQIRRQTAGYLHAASHVVDAPAAYPQKARYSFPFDGKSYVFNGGVEWATSPSWDIVGQRYAYGIVIADGTLRRWQGAGKRLDDYYCYGMPILAPTAGVIV